MTVTHYNTLILSINACNSVAQPVWGGGPQFLGRVSSLKFLRQIIQRLTRAPCRINCHKQEVA